MAPNASDDPWATWASSDESQASGGTAEVSQSSTPGDPASTSAGDGRQGQTSAPAWHNSSSWDVSSNQWSWDSYGYPNRGDAWGQSSWDRYGWWSRPQTGDFRHQWWSSPGPWGKWAYDHDDSGRSGPDSEKQQGSDTSAEAGSHSSEGSARAQEPMGSNDSDDVGDKFRRQASAGTADDTSATRTSTSTTPAGAVTEV